MNVRTDLIPVDNLKVLAWLLGNFTREAQIMQNRYEERTTIAIDTIKQAMAKANRDLWKCDPRTHIEGNVNVIDSIRSKMSSPDL